MQIATYGFFVVGSQSQSFKIPELHGHGTNSVSPHTITNFLDKVAIVNLGSEDAFVLTGESPGMCHVTSESGLRCPAGKTTLIIRSQGHTHFGAVSGSAMPAAFAVGLGA